MRWKRVGTGDACIWLMQAKAYGPGISGALFGGGWWFWVDACAASHTKVPFVQYLPGIVATLALIMINAIRRYVFHEGRFSCPNAPLLLL